MERRSRHKSGKYIICMAFRLRTKVYQTKKVYQNELWVCFSRYRISNDRNKKKGRIKCYQIWYAGYKRLVKKNEVSKL